MDSIDDIDVKLNKDIGNLGLSSKEDIDIFKNIAEKLTKPVVFLCIGQSQIGKSTFLNKVFGKEKVEIGNTGKSCTKDVISVPIKIKNNECKFVDTPGLLDSSGKIIDNENKNKIIKFVENDISKSEQLVILIFSKFIAPLTGELDETIQFVKEISDRRIKIEPISILNIFTFSNVNLNEFPNEWVKIQKTNSNNLIGKDLLLYCWRKWKNNKIIFIQEHLNLNKELITICIDFGEYTPFGDESDGKLLDGTNIMTNIAEGLEKACFSGLYLMKLNAPDNKTKEIANDTLTGSIKTCLKNAGVAATTYGIFNGLILGSSMATEASTVTGAIGLGLQGLGVGFTAGSLVSSLVIIPIAVIGCFVYFSFSKLG